MRVPFPAASFRKSRAFDPFCGPVREVTVMQMGRRSFVAAAVTALTTAVGAAGTRQRSSRLRTIPQVDCNMPEHDYVHAARSQPGLALSQRAELVPVHNPVSPDTLPGGHKMFYYQLKQSEVSVEHCSISRVALAIRDDGYWTLSLRADQNAADETEPPLVAVGRPRPAVTTTVPGVHHILPGSSPTTKFTAHIKRNLFTVKVRGYAAFATEGTLDGSPGRPVLFELAPSPFWVQRQVPAFLKFQGKDPGVLDFFWTIDRVEVELTFF
jgi:hypothetical protein